MYGFHSLREVVLYLSELLGVQSNYEQFSNAPQGVHWVHPEDVIAVP
jgi:hypothetical protein